VCGVRIDALNMACAVERLLHGGVEGAVHLCNAYTLSLATHDDGYRQRLNDSALNLPDGMPLVWIARRLSLHELNDRVYGPTLMATCLDQGRRTGARHYLYGSTPQVLDALRNQIEARWPGAEIVGVESPPFRPLTDDELRASLQRVAAARATIVWVGMGTPKQDDLVHRMAAAQPGTYVAVGAAFDFIAGTKKQAPPWMQRSGLEWLYRLGSEPKRLWRRYLVGNTQFIWSVIRCRPVTIHEEAGA
jgi:N-acetylglucosaminyldiphosphoundecaprenol N-acetyl-beta-D-mannosaminyltransferase